LLQPKEDSETTVPHLMDAHVGKSLGTGSIALANLFSRYGFIHA